MTIEECYRELDGNFAEVSLRLPTRSMVERFAGRFPEDTTFDDLCAQMQAGDREKAFRAAHTLKGVCANLSFTRLCRSATRLTEILRPQLEAIPAEADEALEEVKQDYARTLNAIRQFQTEK